MDHWTEAYQNLQRIPQSSWRAYCDSLNRDLIARWWGGEKKGRLLKTDLFEEAMGSGLCRNLSAIGGPIFGIDYSRQVAAQASNRNEGLNGAVADVRNLPYQAEAFDGVLSTSTLDHFPSRSELLQSLGEVARVLRPGGALILTLDNLGNPLIRLRQLLPFRLLHRLGILPYYVGYTCSFRTFRSILRSAGFDLIASTAIAHCPRVPAIVLARWADRCESPKCRLKVQSILMAFEAMAGWPTRFITGNYFAVKAVKASPEQPLSNRVGNRN